MLTLTFAGDEAGDVGFAFGKGSSRHFVVAMIATAFPDALRDALVSVRQDAGLPNGFEFSFHSLTSGRWRRQVFEALAKADFEAWAIMVDKTSLPDSFKMISGLDFYLYFVTELIHSIPLPKLEDGILILDEFGSATDLRTELRRVLTVRGIPHRFRRIHIKRSKSEPLIQIADLIAGAILRRDAKSDSEAYEIIERRIRRVLDFG